MERKLVGKYSTRTFPVVIAVLALRLWITILPATTPESHSRKDSWNSAPTCNWTSRYQVVPLQLPARHELNEFLEGPGLLALNATRAACKLVDDNHSHHLPHAMQQLYRCFSWWKSNPHMEPFLISRNPQNSQFVKGFVASLRSVFNVTVVRLRNSLKVVRPIVEYGFEEKSNTGFSVKSTADLSYLRERTLEFYQLSQREGGCGFGRSHVPRIAILNRRSESGRNLLLVNQLQESMQHKFMLHIPTFHFDNRTYLEQVKFFAETDILISPHGAQLTGLPFMPKCGSVLEIFPVGYFIPKYFGSLAASAGLSYSYLYTGGDLPLESGVWMKDLASREMARSSPICPNIDAILLALDGLKSKWERCCDGK